MKVISDICGISEKKLITMSSELYITLYSVYMISILILEWSLGWSQDFHLGILYGILISKDLSRNL